MAFPAAQFILYQQIINLTPLLFQIIITWNMAFPAAQFILYQQIINLTPLLFQIIITWNMAFPAAQFIVLLMAEHNRSKVFLGISHFLRIISLVQLTVLFIRRSVFWEVSSLTGSSSLPFAEKSFGVPEYQRSYANFYQSDNKVTKRH